MAIVEVCVVPLGTGSTSVSGYVAACHKVLQQEKDLQYQLTPMATIIEGDLDKIMAAIRKMHEVPFAAGAGRVNTIIRIDDRRDQVRTMADKIASVEEKL